MVLQIELQIYAIFLIDKKNTARKYRAVFFTDIGNSISVSPVHPLNA